MNYLRVMRTYVPTRVTEVLALVSLVTCLVLFIHTSQLESQLLDYTNQVEQLSAARGPSQQEQQREQQKIPLNRWGPLSADNLNNTRLNTKLTLMFNRVPKVGSQSTMELLRSLSYKNGFTFHRDRPQKHESIKLTTREEKKLVKLVDTFRPPSAYVKHVCYLNFTQYNFTQPIYVNMVRDPVERAISWYYYVRAPWYFVERKQAFPELPLPSSKWLRKDYETCVANGDTECSYEEGGERPDFAQLTEFFCGQDAKCTGFNTDYAMKKAKENVEKNYAVVGILEEMNMTLTVLEHYIPRYFKGAKRLYWEERKKYSRVNKNIYKPKVENRVKEIVRKNFTREIEFYEFCRERLHKQYAALNLPPDALNSLDTT